LWKPISVDASSLVATEAPEASTCKVKLQQLTKDMIDAQKKFADYAYDFAVGNAQLNAYYDPVKFAMIAVEAHKTNPSVSLEHLINTGLDYSTAVDPDHVAKWGHGQAEYYLATEQKLTPQQKTQIADRTAQSLHDAYAAAPPPKVADVNSLFQKCYNEAKAGAGAPGATAAAPQPSPQQQPQQAGSPQQSQQQPPKPPDNTQAKNDSQVDKAVNEAHKAKGAVNKLKGLFGH
jgi:hypothetical protein